MKKFLGVFLILVGVAFAEENEPKWVFDVGGGFAFYSSFTNFALGLKNFDHYEDEPLDEIDGDCNMIVANMGTRYQLMQMLELGLTMGYEYYSSKVNPYENEKGFVKYADTKDNHIIHLAAEAKIDWINFSKIQFYSRVGAGVQFDVEKIDDYEMNLSRTLQLSPIGIEYVNTVGFYTELGIGYRGLYSAGISFRL